MALSSKAQITGNTFGMFHLLFNKDMTDGLISVI